MKTQELDTGFTLVELLVTVAIIGLLLAILMPALNVARESARASACARNMREIGMAAMLYAADHDGRYPRSQHSAFVHREVVWARSLARYLGETDAGWSNLLRSVYRCPSDRRPAALSFGLNVYFELGPEDDYEGKPATWRTNYEVPVPSRTILFAENESAADHIMPNYWAGSRDVSDVAHDRHRGSANYIFADGHVERHTLNEIYDPARAVDQWHPLHAR